MVWVSVAGVWYMSHVSLRERSTMIEYYHIRKAGMLYIEHTLVRGGSHCGCVHVCVELCEWFREVGLEFGVVDQVAVGCGGPIHHATAPPAAAAGHTAE